MRLLCILYATLSHNPPPQAMCLQVRDALTVGSISLSSHFFSIKMDVKEALKALADLELDSLADRSKLEAQMKKAKSRFDDLKTKFGKAA